MARLRPRLDQELESLWVTVHTLQASREGTPQPGRRFVAISSRTMLRDDRSLRCDGDMNMATAQRFPEHTVVRSLASDFETLIGLGVPVGTVDRFGKTGSLAIVVSTFGCQVENSRPT
nr:hypothetical protein CFP56_76248 [Quercus suber]